MYTVYLHTRNDTNELFYIGYGSETRPYDTTQRGRHWKHIVAKCGHSIQVPFSYEDKESAAQHEIIYIAAARELGLPIINVANGGDGGSTNHGVKQTGEWLERRSEAMKGNTNAVGHGAPKGHIPWNKGKAGTYSTSKKGTKLSPEVYTNVCLANAKNKGKTLEEILGPEKAAAARRKNSESAKAARARQKLLGIR